MVRFESDNYGTFGGLVISPDKIKEADVVLQSIPYENATSGKKGTSFAASALRAISKDMQLISRTGINLSEIKIADMGNVSINSISGENTRKNIFESMKFLLENSSAPIISIGGDHSITFPLLQAVSELGNIGIIWFDAHRDLLDYYLNSKFSHGSSLRRIIELNNVDPKNILLVGTRYFTIEEEEFVRNHGIKEVKQCEIEQHSNPVEGIIQKIKELANQVDFIYFSIDIDGLDPAYAPGTGTPVSGGMNSSQFMQIIRNIPVPIRAFDIVEVSPPLDPSGITTKTLLAILTEIIAQIKTAKHI
jgi:agmatinase